MVSIHWYAVVEIFIQSLLPISTHLYELHILFIRNELESNNVYLNTLLTKFLVYTT